MKTYIVLWEMPDKYWHGGGCVGNRQEAKQYALAELPNSIQSRSLYRIGENAPLSWKYVSTCGGFATIEEY